MQFISDRQRRAAFASMSDTLPGLGQAITGKVVGLWPDPLYSEYVEVNQHIEPEPIQQPQPVQQPQAIQQPQPIQQPVQADPERCLVEGDDRIIAMPLERQFKHAIVDKRGEAELYRNMAGKVDEVDAEQLNYLAEQEEWNEDALRDMRVRYDDDVLPDEITEEDVREFGRGLKKNG